MLPLLPDPHGIADAASVPTPCDQPRAAPEPTEHCGRKTQRPGRPRALLAVAAAIGTCAIVTRADDVTFEKSHVLLDARLEQSAPPTLADIDGDGDLDLAVGGTFWLENTDGLGSLGSPRHIVTVAEITGGASFAQAIGAGFADIDGDGDLDELVIGFIPGAGPSLAYWIPNLDGDGTFGAPVLIGESSSLGRLAAFDIDGDGDLDVVRSGAGTGCEWQANLDGSGTFGPPILIDDAPAIRFAVADVDGDNDLDCVTDRFGETFFLNENQGDGTFAAPSAIATTLSAFWLELADLNGDGAPDLLLGDIWHANDGTGTFGPEMKFAATFLDSVAVDIDGDGDLDVAGTEVGPGATGYVWYENDGTGHFPTVTPIPNFGYNAAFGDMDGDGDLDITLERDAHLYLLANDGGTFTESASVTTGVARPPQIVDVDGDGDLDVLVDLLGAPEIGWFEQLADGSFTSKQAIDVPFDGNVTAGDLDGDGDVDLIHPSFLLGWYENEGDLMFGPEQSFPIAGFEDSTPFLIRDIDGDGDNDVFEVNSNPRWIENLAGDGSSWAIHSIATQTVAQVLSDMDGDGDLDLVGGGSNGIDVLFFAGGSFGPAVTLDPARSLTAPLAGDFDGDGDLDVTYRYIVQGVGAFARAVENLDGSSFGPPIELVGGEFAGLPLDAADVDGDGDDDIIGRTAWLENTDGAFAFALRNNHPALADAVDDIDADGAPDLVGGVFVVMEPGPVSNAFSSLGAALGGTLGEPSLIATGCLVGDTQVTLALSSALPGATTTLVLGMSELSAPFKGGVLVPTPTLLVPGLLVDAAGTLTLASTWPIGIPPDVEMYFQYWIIDAGGPAGLAASNGVVGTTP